MKISKLFHYLYAFLMFMPVFAVAVKCGYVMLNQNANESYTGSYRYYGTYTLSNFISNTDITPSTIIYNNVTNYKYQNNFFASADFIAVNNGFNNVPTMFFTNELTNSDGSIIPISSNYNAVIFWQQTGNYYNQVLYFYDIDYSKEYYIVQNSNQSIQLMWQDTQILPVHILNRSVSRNPVRFTSLNNYFLRVSNNTSSFNMYTIQTWFTDTNLSAVFYSSIQELDNTAFFGWARHSFIAEPFLYIGNLFGIPDVHPIFTFLSYWMAISVIWLVFDLFMYVPLLVHRWIDKAKVD